MNASRFLPLLVPVLLAACATQGQQSVPVRSGAGTSDVIGKDARALVLLFGEPDQDLVEGPARRLQFASAVCVLDAYLYPPERGREPVVTHVDARLPSSDDIDPASCVAAMLRRKEAR